MQRLWVFCQEYLFFSRKIKSPTIGNVTNSVTGNAMRKTSPPAARESKSKRGKSTPVVDRRIEAALGQVVRELRRRAGLGISEIARRANLSPGMVSKIENGAISPSLSSIRSLARALQVPVTSLFREFDEVTDATIVRAGEGTMVHRSGRSLDHEYRVLGQTTAKGIAVEPFMMTFTEASQVLPFLHRTGTQFIHVLEGQFYYRHGSKTYLMAEGDSLLFQADVPHGPETLLRTPVRYISVLCFLGGGG
ncbi:helix-turn-helix domain-containing protein [Leptospira interrogans]